MARTQEKQKIRDVQGRKTGCLTAGEWILEIYIFLLLAVFPFYNTDHYFSILSDRVGFFQTVTLVMAAVFFIEERLNGSSHGKEGMTAVGMEGGRVGFSWGFLFLGMFLIVSAVSTGLSEYRAEAWKGDAGRLQGLSMWLLYGIAFSRIACSFWLKKRHLYLLFASGTVVAIWGICDYMGPGLSWWLADVKETQREMFTSSIGNINTYTAFLAICFSLSGAYIIHEDQINRKAWGILTSLFFLLSVALVAGRSDNAVIGIFAFFLVMPLTLGGTRQIGRYLALLGVFIMTLPFVGILSQYMENPYIAGKEGILLRISMNGRSAPCMVILGCSFLSAAAYLWRKEKAVPGFKKVWLTILAVAGIAFTAVFIHINFFGGTWRHGVVGAYLKFNDDWGTYRGLCWRLAYESYDGFPLIKKLVGSGPETFGIIMKREHYKAMVDGCGKIFDSPHNELIQHLFCTGILGAVCYYGFLASCFVKGIRQKAVKKAAAIAILVYTAVSLVNISVPITQPYLILLTAWCSGTENNASQ